MTDAEISVLDRDELLQMTVDIVSAYVSNNAIASISVQLKQYRKKSHRNRQFQFASQLVMISSSALKMAKNLKCSSAICARPIT